MWKTLVYIAICGAVVRSHEPLQNEWALVVFLNALVAGMHLEEWRRDQWWG